MKLKKTFLYGFSILSLTCLSSAQDAPKGPPPDGGPPPGGPPPGGNPAERIAAFVKRADTNGDGKISKEEFIEQAKKDNEERFARVDTNGDGTISKDEYFEQTKKDIEERFSRMDANGDGVVDQDEIGKMVQMMGRGGPGAPGGRPPGGEGGGFRRPPEGEGGPPGSPGQGMRPEGDGGRRGGGMFGDPKETFKRLDADGNGSISEDEYIKGVEKMREMFRGRGGQPGPGGMNRPGEGGRPGGEGGFRRPPAEGDAPKAPEAKPDAPAPDKPKEEAK